MSADHVYQAVGVFPQVPYKPGFTLFAQRHSTTTQKTWFFFAQDKVVELSSE